MKLKGTKIVEVPYFVNQIEDVDKSILIVGECKGGEEGVSESVHAMGCKNVTTTDILESLPDSWLRKNTNWEHVKTDFIKFDESRKFDFIISVSVFEHFGMFWEGKAYDIDSDLEDLILWNHDIKGILKACRLLKDSKSKLVITLPVGPYMNYQETGYPFLRYYDKQRQELVKQKIYDNNYYVSDESFFVSTDYVDWFATDDAINSPVNYKNYCNPYTPNIIWGITIQKDEKKNIN
jgi:hypothetical protein